MEARLSDTSDSEDDVPRVGFGGQSKTKVVIEPEENLEDESQKSSGSDTEPETTMDDLSPQLMNKTNFKSRRKRGHESADTEDSSARHIKKSRKVDVAHTSSTADVKVHRMMANMGYKTGTGLGKTSQGRLEPVEMSTQRGRRGLGLHIPGLDAASQQWDPTLEEIKVQEDMDWLNNRHPSAPTIDEPQNWIEFGPKNLVIDNELSFCNEDILRRVLSAKSVFDRLDGHELRRARTRSNPYETIRGAFFLNRAAVKMANIDKACNFKFTEPKNLHPNELLYFADVCAGPGGFSEYVLWKKQWHAKGFGFTLKGENDFKLDEFYAGPCETFHPYYGPKQNGDVYDPENQTGFRNLIMEETGGKGVHFMMADGGFSVEGQENIQEILSKQLYLCQCLVALMIVREGGHFVVKLFDLFTHFSVGLVYLMYRCFDQICIFKPNSSRPANSERYLICLHKRPNVSHVAEYLAKVNEQLLHPRQSNVDVIQIVPPSELESEKNFKTYVRESNDILGRQQIIGLVKIAAFCNNPSLTEPTQADMRSGCLAHWGLPIKSRTAPNIGNPQARLQSLFTSASLSFLSVSHNELSEKNLATLVDSPLDWFCMPSASGRESDKQLAMLYLGLGRSNVFRLVKETWIRETNLTLELPANTLVFAERVSELRGEGRSQLKTFALHIFDAYLLGGVDVSHMHLTERMAKITKFCNALRKPRDLKQQQQYARVRAKNLYPLQVGLEDELYSCLKTRSMKSGGCQAMTYAPPLGTNLNERIGDDPYYFAMDSILFLKATKFPWSRNLSRSTGYYYYFNCKTKENKYDKDRPANAVAKFDDSFTKRIVWFWPPSHDLTRDDLADRVRAKSGPPKCL